MQRSVSSPTGSLPGTLIMSLAPVLAFLGMFAIPAITEAQEWDPEAGDVGNWSPPPMATEPANEENGAGGWYGNGESERPPGMGGAPSSASASSHTRHHSSGNTDHDAVAASIGVGFFGVGGIQLDPGLLNGISLDTPSVGIRYWFGNVGLDAALGLGFTDFGFKEDGGAAVGGLASAFGLSLHAGLPIALHHASHFTTELIPELDFSYGKATVLGRDPANDSDFKGLDLNLGIRLGGELQFGFIGLPQLGLQATIGVGLHYFRRTAQGADLSVINSSAVAPGVTEVVQSGIRAGTTLNNVFQGTIRLVYYIN